jgi:hypothetical protein
MVVFRHQNAGWSLLTANKSFKMAAKVSTWEQV